LAAERIDLPVHSCGVVAGKVHPKRKSAFPGGGSEPASDALHELALVVLCEDQDSLEAFRRFTGCSEAIECREHGWRGNSGRPVCGQSGIRDAAGQEQEKDGRQAAVIGSSHVNYPQSPLAPSDSRE
jgi:hypothetical protein